jgi:hypothetical protein
VEINDVVIRGGCNPWRFQCGLGKLWQLGILSRQCCFELSHCGTWCGKKSAVGFEITSQAGMNAYIHPHTLEERPPELMSNWFHWG